MSKRNKDQYRRLRRAQEFMDAHIGDPLRIDMVSDIACYSQFHFIRKFAQIYNKTPKQYLIERRIEQAKRQLKRDEESVIDICLGLGFESPSSFSNLFKRQTGLSPTEYRRLQQRIFTVAQIHPIIHVPACFAMFFAPQDVAQIPKEF